MWIVDWIVYVSMWISVEMFAEYDRKKLYTRDQTLHGLMFHGVLEAGITGITTFKLTPLDNGGGR